MSAKPTRIALIGCGGWAQRTHIPYLLNNNNIELAVLSGVADEKEGSRLAEKYHFTKYEVDWTKVAQRHSIDAVVISTPHALHYEQIKTFLHAGCHVHVDKPPTLRSEELKELKEYADANGLILSVHAQMKYMPGLNKLRSILASNFSSIYQVNAYIWQKLFSDFNGSWRSEPDLAGGGIMMDSGYHMIDTVHYILDHRLASAPTFLAHTGSKSSDTIGLLTYKLGDAVVSVSAVRGAPQFVRGQRIEIFGDTGYAEFKVIEKNGIDYSVIGYQNMDGGYESHEFAHDYDYKTDPLELFIKALHGNNSYVLHEINQNVEISDSVIKVLENAYKKGV